MKKILAALVGLIALAVPAIALATAPPTCTITGVVYDLTGSIVPTGTPVVFQSLATQGLGNSGNVENRSSLHVTTDASGNLNSGAGVSLVQGMPINVTIGNGPAILNIVVPSGGSCPTDFQTLVNQGIPSPPSPRSIVLLANLNGGGFLGQNFGCPAASTGLEVEGCPIGSFAASTGQFTSVIMGGALSGVTSLTMSGALATATTIANNGTITDTSGGIILNLPGTTALNDKASVAGASQPSGNIILHATGSGSADSPATIVNNNSGTGGDFQLQMGVAGDTLSIFASPGGRQLAQFGGATPAFTLAPVATGASQSSQSFKLQGTNGSSATQTIDIHADLNGSLIATLPGTTAAHGVELTNGTATTELLTGGFAGNHTFTVGTAPTAPVANCGVTGSSTVSTGSNDWAGHIVAGSTAGVSCKVIWNNAAAHNNRSCTCSIDVVTATPEACSVTSVNANAIFSWPTSSVGVGFYYQCVDY